MLIYFDNDVASMLTRKDNPQENEAAESLVSLHCNGKIRVCCSRQSHREMERAGKDSVKSLVDGIGSLELVDNDHEVLGFHVQSDYLGGFVACPLVNDVVDGPVYGSLRRLGMKHDDAMHFMYAVHKKCRVFVTVDKHFLGRAKSLKEIEPEIEVMKPSEMVARLKQQGLL